jgi:myb proto-oncogene protein
VRTFGVGKWAEIARHCQGRTDQQCMGRWRRHLDPAIKRDSWTPEEDAKLTQLHLQYGTSWSRISRLLKGRTSQQCRARWHQLHGGRAGRSGGGGAGSGGNGAVGGSGGEGGPPVSGDTVWGCCLPGAQSLGAEAWWHQGTKTAAWTVWSAHSCSPAALPVK